MVRADTAANLAPRDPGGQYRGMRALLVVAAIAMAACSPSPPPAPAVGTPAPTGAATSTPGPTSATTSPAATAAPTTSTPATGRAPAAATGGCSDLPVASLARPGASVVRVVCVTRAGDAPIAAVQEHAAASPGPEPPTAYVELFTKGPQGWGLLVDLSKYPPGRPLVGEPGQIVETLIPLDFDGDGTDSLVLGVQVVAASAGPLEVSVLSFRGVDVAVDFQEGTDTGGVLTVEGRFLVLETGLLGGNPRCCPSAIRRQRIGWNPTTKRVEVLEQTDTPVATRS